MLFKKAEYPKNVTAYLNEDFVEPVGIFQVFKIDARNPVKIFYHFKCPKYFLLNFLRLFTIKISKIMLIKIELTDAGHSANIIKVVHLDY